MSIPPKAAPMAKGPAKERLVTELPKNTVGADDSGEDDPKAKPGMTSTFNPMDFLNPSGSADSDKDGDKDGGKGSKDNGPPTKPERAPEPKRTPEEEEEYINLLHSIAEKPVVKDDEIDEARFDEVLTDCIRLARKNKEWFSVWSNCAIRGHDNTVQATRLWVDRMTAEPVMDDDKTTDLLGFLMKQKEIGPKAMAEAITTITCSGRNKNEIVGMLLANIFPTEQGGFGWSRVGWGFKEWFQEVKKFVRGVDDAAVAIEKAITLVAEWGITITADKQEKVIQKMIECGVERDEAIERLGFSGDVNVKPSPSPSPDNSDDQ